MRYGEPQVKPQSPLIRLAVLQTQFHKPSLSVYSAVSFVMWSVFFHNHSRGLNPAYLHDDWDCSEFQARVGQYWFLEYLMILKQPQKLCSAERDIIVFNIKLSTGIWNKSFIVCLKVLAPHSHTRHEGNTKYLCHGMSICLGFRLEIHRIKFRNNDVI